MNNIVAGALRGLGLVVLFAVLGWAANATNLNGLVNPMTASIISIVALTLEQALSPKGTAVFGAIKVS